MAVKNKMLLNLIIDNEGTAKKKKKIGHLVMERDGGKSWHV